MADHAELVSFLVEKNVLNEHEAQRRLAQHGGNELELLEELAQEFPLFKELLGRYWGDHLNVAYIDLEKTIIDYELANLIPEEFARKYRLVPVIKFGEAITVACANPADQERLTLAENYLDTFASPVFSFPGDVDAYVDVAYQSLARLNALLEETCIPLVRELGGTVLSMTQIEELAGSEGVMNFASGLLMLAVKENATDIHIEPEEAEVRIRFRIDGVLQKRFEIDRAVAAPLVSRLKVMAGLDIAETRRPQDGHFSFDLHSRKVDIRQSCVPTIHGEKVVLRILGQVRFQRNVPELSELGFSHDAFEELIRILHHPSGVFFVTGPTGSGKTTTLCSALRRIASDDVNVMTIEDPVEYRLKGINQVQVNQATGLDFATALRSFLRQDPDIILIGEVRDKETARIAAQAALTGHLVLATMHTNSALQAIIRLIDIGVEPFFVAPSILGVMAQRLVRRICDKCKEPYIASGADLERYFIYEGKPEVTLYRGRGCAHCHNTGYLGRIAIHEIYAVDEEMRRLIAQNAPYTELEAHVRGRGGKPLLYDALRKVLLGATTLDEVERLIVAE